MLKLRTPVLAILLFSALGNYAHSACWSTFGCEWSDSDIPVPLWANQNGTSDCDGEFNHLRYAAAGWNRVTNCYFAFKRGGLNTRTVPVYDGYNQMAWTYQGGSGGYVAAVYIWCYGGLFYETDNDYNDYYPWSASTSPPPGTMDVWNVSAHEFGHIVGLDDQYSSSCSHVTMYGYVAYGETKKRTLEYEDSTGARYLYPGADLSFSPLKRVSSEEGGVALEIYPHPISSSAIINYRITKPSPVRIAIYNTEGQLVKTLLEGKGEVGSFQILWDGQNREGQRMAAGIYFCQLQAGDECITRKIIVLK